MTKLAAKNKTDARTPPPTRANLPEILSPTEDIIFKILFGDERNKDILADFLTAVLGFDVKPDDITLLDPHLARDWAGDKLGILDVKLKLASGKFINIEMQVENLKDMRNRIEYYISNMMARQLEESGKYLELLPVVAIIVSKQTMLKETTRFHCEFGTLEKTEHFELHGLRAIHTLELSKLPNDVSGRLEDWLKFINSEKKEEYMALAQKNTLMRKALGVLQRASADPRTRDDYFYSVMAIADQKARAGGWIDEAEAKGLAKGRLEGATSKALEVARKMKAEGIDVRAIARMTDLSPEEILTL